MQSQLLNKIHEYILSMGASEQEIQKWESSSISLAQEIAIFAHKDQKRENGANYFVHPWNVLTGFHRLIGCTQNSLGKINKKLLLEKGIPFDGVQEVCLLHDVVEDSDITIEQLEEAFECCGYKETFIEHIKQPLLLVTRAKDQEYEEYFISLLENPVASLIKFMDLFDNMNPFDLGTFEKKQADRIKKYTDYALRINEKWHFFEKAGEYREQAIFTIK